MSNRSWSARHSIARLACVALLIPAAGLLAACGDDDDSATVHKLGTVTIEGTPKRVVTLGLGDNDAARAVGVTPVGMVKCSSFGNGLLPRVNTALGGRKPTVLNLDTGTPYFGALTEAKRMLLDYHRNTSYSVVDPELIEDLYRRSYQEKVSGRERLRILQARKLLGVAESPDSVVTSLESLATGERIELESDAVVFATGYRPMCPLALLGRAHELCALDADGMVCIERDYRARMTCPLTAGTGIYLQGPTEHTHGLSSTLLSNTAVRAGEILASIVERRESVADESLVGAGSRA